MRGTLGKNKNHKIHAATREMPCRVRSAFHAVGKYTPEMIVNVILQHRVSGDRCLTRGDARHCHSDCLTTWDPNEQQMQEPRGGWRSHRKPCSQMFANGVGCHARRKSHHWMYRDITQTTSCQVSGYCIYDLQPLWVNSIRILPLLSLCEVPKFSVSFKHYNWLIDDSVLSFSEVHRHSKV